MAATALLVLACLTTTTPGAAVSPIDPSGAAGSFYMARTCPTNAALDRVDKAWWWMGYGKKSLKIGTPTTREYRKAARQAAVQLQRTADEFRA